MTWEIVWGLILLFFVGVALTFGVTVLAFAAGFLEGKGK